MKYFGFFLFNLIALFQVAKCDFDTCKWVSTGFKNLSGNFYQETSELSLLCGGKWISPTCTPQYYSFPVPGAICPRNWEKKWGDVYFASLHKLLLRYWWKWPGSMLNIELNTDFRTESQTRYLHRVDSALSTAMEKILQKFVDIDLIDRKQKETYGDTFKLKLVGMTNTK